MSLPVYAQAALGYRQFSVTHDGGLKSVGAGNMRWRPGSNTAYCGVSTNHDAPAQDCTCGLYAYHAVSDAVTHGQGLVTSLAMRGDLQVHRHGMRAHKAAITGILIQKPSQRKAAEQAGRVYAVPVFDDIQTFQAHAQLYAAEILSKPAAPETTTPPEQTQSSQKSWRLSDVTNGMILSFPLLLWADSYDVSYLKLLMVLFLVVMFVELAMIIQNPDYGFRFSIKSVSSFLLCSSAIALLSAGEFVSHQPAPSFSSVVWMLLVTLPVLLGFWLGFGKVLLATAPDAASKIVGVSAISAAVLNS